MYEAAKQDKDFLEVVAIADPKDTSVPKDTEANRIAFAAVYYGYLIGRHGIYWKNHVVHSQKSKL